jgi:putative glutamine amidotransferase
MNARRAIRTRTLIGLSPRLLARPPAELGFRGKTLQYLEQSIAHWIMGCNAVVVMIPTVQSDSVVRRSDLSVHDYAASLDGLVLQGGADIHPSLYGEEPSEAVGPTDPVRDRFELELLKAFVEYGKPVLGVCRGMQLINVGFGGALHHDLTAGGATAALHYIRDLYDEHAHELTLRAGGWLESLYPGRPSARVNSIHHQGVKTLGRGLQVEAWSEDGVIECIRAHEQDFVVGVQWHPEFHDERFPDLLPTTPLLNAFVEAAQARR